jgi:hypothetical protein
MGWVKLPSAHAITNTLISIDPPHIAGLTLTSGTVTFHVNMTNAPSINQFYVAVAYNPQVLGTPAVDYSINVLGSSAQVFLECIDGLRIAGVVSDCRPWDQKGIVSLGLFLFSTSTTAPTTGRLFQITFNIISSQGFSKLHLLRVFIGTGKPGVSTSQPYSPFDGYFTNMDCPTGSGTLCSPPIPSFTYTPGLPTVGHLTNFNASSSKVTNSQGVLVQYLWEWGDPLTPDYTSDSLFSHRFAAACNCSVTLTVTDNYNVAASVTIVVQVIYVYVEVAISQLVPETFVHNLLPGAVVHVTMTLVNKSTLDEWVNATASVENKVLYNSSSLFHSNDAKTVKFTWDTTGKGPGLYEISGSIAPVKNANATRNNSARFFVQLIYAQPTGGLSLSLVQSFGLGILIVAAGGFGLSRYLASEQRKKRRIDDANI